MESDSSLIEPPLTPLDKFLRRAPGMTKLSAAVTLASPSARNDVHGRDI